MAFLDSPSHERPEGHLKVTLTSKPGWSLVEPRSDWNNTSIQYKLQNIFVRARQNIAPHRQHSCRQRLYKAKALYERKQPDWSIFDIHWRKTSRCCIWMFEKLSFWAQNFYIGVERTQRSECSFRKSSWRVIAIVTVVCFAVILEPRYPKAASFRNFLTWPVF